MSSNWDNIKKTTSIDESIISNPWENASNGNNITNLVAPNPVSPIISHNQQSQDDVASIISGLSNVNKGSVLSGQATFLGGYKQAPGLSVFDDAVISDSGSDALRDAISAISAPVATQSLNKSRFGSNIFGPASVAGVNVTNLKNTTLSNSGVSFLEKFSAVTEKTRELETANGIGSRRSSMFNNDPKSPQQLFREPRKQSFSEKLESYISATTSPNASRHLSISSEATAINTNNNVASEHNSIIIENVKDNNDKPTAFKTHWNPANITPFHPSYPMHDMTFIQHQNMMMSGGFPMNPQDFNGNGFLPQMFPPFIPAGPFGMPPNIIPNSKDAKSEQMKLTDTTRSEYGSKNSESDDNEELIENDDESKLKENKDNQKPPTPHEFYPVGLNRSVSPYVMAPFSPYGIFNPNGANFPPMIPTPGSPICATPSPMMIPQMMGGSPIDPRNIKVRSSTPPIKNSKSPLSSSFHKKAGKSSKIKNKHIVRSPLLEDFRNNKDKKYNLSDIISHGYEFAKDQHGSRFIQQELSTAPDDIVELFFKEIRNNALDLMTDVFGNYVIQKYFEHGSIVQKKVLFESMRGSFNFLSLQMYGCRVVQKCIEGVPLSDQLEIIEELKPNILNLVKDQNGNHVIQKAIEKIPIEKIPFVLDSLRHQIYHLSMHPYGCRVIQRLLECSNTADQEFILNELKGFIYYLIQDQFGNYVIQHIIESGKKKDSDVILNVVLENLIELSKHKFASNAVEKCIINLPVESRIKIYETMLKDNLIEDGELSEQSNLMLMMKDPFANYVVQKMVELIDTERKKLLVSKIKQYLKLIQKNSHGKHLASIEKLNNICRLYDF
jgi:mRNA-binding protein PUF3